MENKGMLVKIMSPIESVICKNATSVVLKGYDGEYCIQYNHIPMAIATVPGIITATVNGEKKQCNTRGNGFALINKNKIVVFVDGIIH